MTTRVAVILAAGAGTRLKPLTDDRPKALVDVGGETILARALRLLVAHGVSRVVVATGYRDDAIQSALAGSSVDIEFCRNDRYDCTQNVASLAACAAAVGEESFFKLDGDVVFTSDVLTRLDASDADLAVAVDRARVLDAEAMKVEADGLRILAFGKELPLDDSAGETIGIERLSATAAREVLEASVAATREGDDQIYYEEIYSRAVRRGLSAAAVDVSDLPWAEIDDVADLERARSLLRPGR